jgi:outer membrane protein W
MKKIFFFMIVCSLLITSKSYGQQGSYISAQYAVSFGTGDLSDYISKASWRGVLLEYRSAVLGNLMVGADVGWNVFYEKKAYDTYSVGTESLSGIQYRNQNIVPVLASADYLILSDKTLKPYVGLGLGTIYSERATDMGIYRWVENTWQFALKGELGLLYQVSYNSSIKFAAKYYNGFKTNSLDSQGYFSLSLGMAWEL